jgi:VanZ family protein
VLSFWDKAQHTLGFLALAWLAAVSGEHWRRITLGLLAWGALIEGLQSLTTWRHGDAWDWLADAVGVALAWVLYRWWALHSTMRS